MRTIPCHGPSGPVTPDLGEQRPNPAPVWGGLTRVDALTGLAGDARERVHENNLRIRWADAERYAAYLKDYLRGALACRTSAELRAYGKPAGVESDLEEGRTQREEWDFNGGPRDRMVSSLLAANEELGGHILRLENEPVPLEAFFELSLTARGQIAGRALGGRLSTRTGAEVEGAVRAGGASLTAGGSGRVAVGFDAGIAGMEATLEQGRVESVEVKARPALGIGFAVKRSTGSAEVALVAGGKIGGKAPGAPGLEIEARAAAGVNLLTAEAVRRAISSRSFWDEK